MRARVADRPSRTRTTSVRSSVSRSRATRRSATPRSATSRTSTSAIRSAPTICRALQEALISSELFESRRGRARAGPGRLHWSSRPSTTSCRGSSARRSTSCRRTARSASASPRTTSAAAIRSSCSTASSARRRRSCSRRSSIPPFTARKLQYRADIYLERRQIDEFANTTQHRLRHRAHAPSRRSSTPACSSAGSSTGGSSPTPACAAPTSSSTMPLDPRTNVAARRSRSKTAGTRRCKRA